MNYYSKQYQYANINNACGGCYGKCLDVKITNHCNGRCSFCIERGGHQPEPVSVEDLIEATNSLTAYQTVLILGGEPFLYPHLYEYLCGIQDKDNIYITTNGTCFDKQSQLPQIASILNGINISLHHYDEKINNEIIGTSMDYSYLKEVIQLFQKKGTLVRINSNLTRNGIHTRDDIFNMIERAESLGVNEIRFAELQNAPEDFVAVNEALGTLFHGLHTDPFKQGCEQVVYSREGFRIIIRQTCGIVNPLRNMPENPIQYSETKVLYPDGHVYDGWLYDTVDEAESPKSCHKSKCVANNMVWGSCHKRISD